MTFHGLRDRRLVRLDGGGSLGLPDLKHSIDPVQIATEGAVRGAIRAHGCLPDTVIVSVDVDQFEVGRDTLCWVHAERLVHKLDTFTDQERRAHQHVRV